LNSKVKKTLKIVFLFSLTFFFLYLAFRNIDFNELFLVLRSANYFYAVAGALIGIVLSGYFRALRWRYFLNPLKENIGIDILFSTTMIGYMSSSIIPRAGEVVRPVLLANKVKISRTSAFGTILAERVCDMLMLLVSFGVCVFYFKEKLSSAFESYNLETTSIWASIITLIFVGLIVFILFTLEKSEIVIEKITKKFLPERFHLRIQNLFVSLINGFLFIKYPKYYFQIFLQSVLIWLSYVISTYLTLIAFNINLNFFDANVILTIVTFPLTIPLPANSAGLFHIFGTVALVNIYGINRETAFGFATVLHLLGLVGLILIGAFYFIKENLDIKKAQGLKESEVISDK
jgi:glycosyltransferase 2 family protein